MGIEEELDALRPGTRNEASGTVRLVQDARGLFAELATVLNKRGARTKSIEAIPPKPWPLWNRLVAGSPDRVRVAVGWELFPFLYLDTQGKLWHEVELLTEADRTSTNPTTYFDVIPVDFDAWPGLLDSDRPVRLTYNIAQVTLQRDDGVPYLELTHPDRTQLHSETGPLRERILHLAAPLLR